MSKKSEVAAMAYLAKVRPDKYVLEKGLRVDHYYIGLKEIQISSNSDGSERKSLSFIHSVIYIMSD